MWISYLAVCVLGLKPEPQAWWARILSYTPSHYFLNLKGDIVVHIKH